MSSRDDVFPYRTAVWILYELACKWVPTGPLPPPPRLGLVRRTCRGRRHIPRWCRRSASQILLRLRVAYWIQWLYLDRRMVLMRPSVVSGSCLVPLADPAEGRRAAIGAVLFS